MKFGIFDTETTGLLLPSISPIEKQPKIIEFGLMTTENSTIISEYNWLIDPKEQITEEIKKITGIKQEDLEGKPSFSELIPEIKRIFSDIDVLVCHNAPFDVGMLSNELKRSGQFECFKMPEIVVCTVQEFQPSLGFRPKLIDLYQHFVGKKLEQTHRALDDVKALYEILIASNFFESFE